MPFRKGDYKCLACDAEFRFEQGESLVCPRCKNDDPGELAPVHVEANEDDDFMNAADYGVG